MGRLTRGRKGCRWCWMSFWRPLLRRRFCRLLPRRLLLLLQEEKVGKEKEEEKEKQALLPLPLPLSVLMPYHHQSNPWKAPRPTAKGKSTAAP